MDKTKESLKTINSLNFVEENSVHKDIIINHLRKQLAQLTRESSYQVELSTLKPVAVDYFQPQTSDIVPNNSNNSGSGSERFPEIASVTRPVSPSSQYANIPAKDCLRKAFCEEKSESQLEENLIQRLHRERQILGGLVTELQRDLSSKDANLGRLTQELNESKRAILDKDNVIMTMHQKKISQFQSHTKKEHEDESYKKKMVDLQKEYNMIEACKHKLEAENKLLGEKFERLKVEKDQIQENEVNLRAKLEETEQRVKKAELNEQAALRERTEVFNQYQRLRNNSLRVVNPEKYNNRPEISDGPRVTKNQSADEFALIGSDHKTLGDDTELLDSLQEMKEKLSYMARKLAATEKENHEQADRTKEFQSEIDSFMERLEDIEAKDSPSIPCAKYLRGKVDALSAFTPNSNQLKELKRFLVKSWKADVDCYQQLEKWARREISTLSAVLKDSSVFQSEGEYDLIAAIRHLADVTSSALIKQQELDRQLQEAHLKCEEEVQSLTQQLKAEHQKDLNETINEFNEKHKAKLKEEAEKVTGNVERRHQEVIKDKDNIIDQMEGQLNETQQLLKEQQAKFESELQDKQEKLTRMVEVEQQLERQEQRVSELSGEVMKKKQEVAEARQSGEAASEDKWSAELESHREQLRQYARTICVLEERLVKMTKQGKDLKSELARLKRINADLQADQKQPQGKDHQQRASSARRPPLDQRKSSMGTESKEPCEKNGSGLRQEIAQLKEMLEDRDKCIATLRSDIAGTRAQLSDLRGELTESQKQEIENAMEHSSKVNADLNGCRFRITQLEEVVANLQQELAEKEATLSKHDNDLKTTQEALTREEESVAQLNSMLSKERTQHNQDLNNYETKHKLTEELTGLGRECHGERHREVIEKQREALSQLRQRMRDLSAAPDCGGGGDTEYHLRQLSSLRREIAELRSQNLMSTVIPESLKSTTNGCIPSLTDSQTHGCKDRELAIAPVRDTAEKYAAEGLQISEEIYLDLTRTITRQLDLTDVKVPGQRSLVYAPPPERVIVQQERKEAETLFCKRISLLRDKLERKERLLVDYEKNLSKLRKLEAQVDDQNGKSRRMVAELKRRDTETQLLRYSLKECQETLFEEQRSLSALKQRRYYQWNQMQTVSQSAQNLLQPPPPTRKEIATRDATPRRPHQCPTDDVATKESRKNRELTERLKRKDHDMLNLKAELSTQKRDLQKASSRLHRLRTISVSSLTR